jgi:hypothetical protein
VPDPDPVVRTVPPHRPFTVGEYDRRPLLECNRVRARLSSRALFNQYQVTPSIVHTPTAQHTVICRGKAMSP